MPELPEVQTITSDLQKKLIGHTIKNLKLLWPGIIKEIKPNEFKKIVIGKKITAIERRAKNIRIRLEGGLNLLIHLKMTGHLIYIDDSWQVDNNGRWIQKGHRPTTLSDPLNQSIRAIFYLDKGKLLAFSDIRKFAYIKLLTDSDIERFFNDYGPEPLSRDFNLNYFKTLLSSKKLAVKKVLMDQKNIAGIGNIYADEILYEAGIHPLTPASSLNEEEIKKLFLAIKNILKKATRLRGTSTSDFRDIYGKKGMFGEVIAVYRKNGKPCPKDGVIIERIVLGGRGTHFCPKCQVQHD